MSTATFAFTYSNVDGFAPGTVAANVVASVTGTTGPAQVHTVSNGTASVDFDLTPDTYTYSVTNTDASGALLGTAVTGTFVVAVPVTITLSLATAVSVTQS